MLNKQLKSKYIENIKDKEQKIFVSNILDKAIRFEKLDNIFVTNFLNLNELNVAKQALDYFKVEYEILSINEYIEKKNIALIPDYLDKDLDEIVKEHISCVKIIPNVKGKLQHKDYMGAIYSLGIKKEMIGDIIAKEDCAYFFCMKSVEEYFNLNLTSAGRQDISTQIVDIDSDEVKKLSPKFILKEFIIPSLRVDATLSEVYNLSRSETKDKIVKGDLYINDRNIFYPNTIVNEGDIISFKRCGKLKMGKEVRKTKNQNIVIQISLYS